MGRDKYGPWRGRPNEPPLAWGKYDAPVIRKVTGSPNDFFPTEQKGITFPPIASGPVAVSFANSDWIRVLQALYHYEQEHGDEDCKQWRLAVRRAILGVCTRNPDKEQPAGVGLTIDDWRTIWRQVHIASQELGAEWPSWFTGLSDTMVAQIKGDDQDTE